MHPFIDSGELDYVSVGEVFIHIREARDLPSMDITGGSDPYVVLKLGQQTVTTKIIYHTVTLIISHVLRLYVCIYIPVLRQDPLESLNI